MSIMKEKKKLPKAKDILDAVRIATNSYERKKDSKRMIELQNLADLIQSIQTKVPFKISSRGWCYQLEQEGVITKADFDKAQQKINICRKLGLLPIDFCAEDESRAFDLIEELTEETTPEKFIESNLEGILDLHKYYDVAFWKHQEFYIQMIVEKIDLKTLFKPICEKYHIPIADTKGWSDLNLRNNMVQRFKEAEKMGKTPVILYCGDFDPAGLFISETLRKNLFDISKATGWYPDNLEIDRFGLNYDFIIKAKLTWIDNLITGSGKDLASPSHPDHDKPYVRDYIEKYGIRKVEANAIVVQPDMAKNLCEITILKYLGQDGIEKYNSEVLKIRNKIKAKLNKLGLRKFVKKKLAFFKKEME